MCEAMPYEEGNFSHLVNMHGWRERYAQDSIAAGQDAAEHAQEHAVDKGYLLNIRHGHTDAEPIKKRGSDAD